MTRGIVFGASFFSMVVLGACGSEVETPTSSSSNGVGASSGAGGAGGAGGGTSGTGGGESNACGGFIGKSCGPAEWCDYRDEFCGGTDTSGVCKPRPRACPADCPGVCGCDGMFYCNACGAQAAGVDVSGLTSCTRREGAYSAQALFGGLDHLFIRKADVTRNVCVTIHLARPTDNAPGFSFDVPASWGVQTAEISDQASDCEAGAQPTHAVGATSGVGTLTFTLPLDGFFPCDVSIHGTLSFPPGEPWVPASESLDADGVTVEGGCL
jgi:hypothetical protein